MPAAARFLVAGSPWLLYALLAAWAASALAAAPRLLRRLAALSPGGRAALIGILALGAFLRFGARAAHRVYFDEFEHLDIARSLARGTGFSETLAGGLPDFDVRAAPSWPGGHHAALSVAMRFFGPSAATAFAWSALLGTATVLLLFWAALELFEDERGAALAAAFWTLSPLAIAYSGAADLTSSSLFWAAAALAGLAAARREDSPALAAFAALSCAYAAQVRFENALLVAALPLVLPARRRLALLAAAPLAVPALILLANRASSLPGFAGGDLSLLSNAARNLPADAAWLSARLWAALVLVPGALLCAAKRPRALALWALAAAYLAGTACFFRGDFSHGTEDRYALPVLLPLTLAAGAGWAATPAAPALLFAALAAADPARPVSPEHADSLAFARSSAALVPPRAYVVDFNAPFALEASSRPAVSAHFLLEDRPLFERESARVGADRELYLLRDAAWRFAAPAGEALEKDLATDYAFAVIASSGPDSLVRLTPRGR